MGEVMGCSGSGAHHRWALGGWQDGGWGGGCCDLSASRAPWPSSRVVEAGASLGGEERTWLINAPGVGEGEPRPLCQDLGLVLRWAPSTPWERWLLATQVHILSLVCVLFQEALPTSRS